MSSELEIDLVDYRAGRVGDTLVYTVIIISCKKNDQNAWALLSKDIHLEDPNVDWRLLHAWSNADILRHMILERDHAAERFQTIEECGSGYLSVYPGRNVFAFQ